MSLLDPAHRAATGVQQQTALTGAPAPEPTTPYEASWRDFVFAEVWTRPGLDHRARFWISMASATCAGGPPEVLDGYVRGALSLGEVTLAELREAALHLAVYAGWSRGALFDASVTRVAKALGLPPAPFEPIRAAPWDPEARRTEGFANFETVMVFGVGPVPTPFFDAGVVNFVFGEMWTRPGLDQRSRRWLTLVGVAESTAETPIRTHTHAAMASGDATVEELHEFVLQYAIHSGWPKAAVIHGTVMEMGQRIAQGLPYA